MARLRYSLDGGGSWTFLEGSLPLVIPSGPEDDVRLQILGAAAFSKGMDEPPIPLAVILLFTGAL